MKKSNTLFQVSTLNSLMLGDYEGAITVKDLLKHGDTGIGTYDGLDGEAIVLNGKCYNGRADGKVYEMDENDKLPFTTVCHFDESVEEKEISFNSIEDFKAKIDKELSGKLSGIHNHFYMIKMYGTFNVRVRSCFKQEKPYEPLYKVACDQRENEYHNEEGYVIGVYCPNYVSGMNLFGWHIHFLNKELTHGGHILKVATVGNAKYKINKLTTWELFLPEDSDFTNVDLTVDLEEKTKAVEGASK